MHDILSERRLRWLGHVVQMDHQRMYLDRRCTLGDSGFKRGPGRPRTNWRSTVNKDLLRMGITWEEAEVSSKQIRMASKCGPMHPLEGGLNQCQCQVCPVP